MTDKKPWYKDKVDFIFRAVDASGIYFTDFARLTKVSRESLYAWKNGNAITDRLRLDLVYTYATRIEKACRLGYFPLKDKLKKEERLKILRQIVADMATK